jgi:ribonuclease D
MTAANQARMHLLNAWIHQRALELNIAPGLLVPQKMLERMVTGDGRSALKGWRDPLLGAELGKLLDSNASLSTDASGITYTESFPEKQ